MSRAFFDFALCFVWFLAKITVYGLWFDMICLFLQMGVDFFLLGWCIIISVRQSERSVSAMPQKQRKSRRRKTFDEPTVTDDFMAGKPRCHNSCLFSPRQVQKASWRNTRNKNRTDRISAYTESYGFFLRCQKYMTYLCWGRKAHGLQYRNADHIRRTPCPAHKILSRYDRPQYH